MFECCFIALITLLNTEYSSGTGPQDRSSATSTWRGATGSPSNQRPPTTTHQQPRIDHTTLVPVYILPEHRHAVEQFVLSLGQPLFSPSSADSSPDSQTTDTDEFYTPEESLHESSLLSDTDSSLSSVELVSLVSPLSLGNEPSRAPLTRMSSISTYNQVPAALQSHIPAHSTVPTNRSALGHVPRPRAPPSTRSSRSIPSRGTVPPAASPFFETTVPAPLTARHVPRTPPAYNSVSSGRFSGTPALVPSTPTHVPPQPIPRALVQVLPNPNPGPYIPAAVNNPAPRNAAHRKYYVICAGKKCGVFWEEWYAHGSHFAQVTHTLFRRTHVEILIKNVSGARYKSFRPFAKAMEYYLLKKGSGEVELIRNPGDDIIFGPLSEAVQ